MRLRYFPKGYTLLRSTPLWLLTLSAIDADKVLKVVDVQDECTIVAPEQVKDEHEHFVHKTSIVAHGNAKRGLVQIR